MSNKLGFLIKDNMMEGSSGASTWKIAHDSSRLTIFFINDGIAHDELHP